MDQSPYTPIHDWSPRGRRRLVEERGDELRLLLDLAFTEFVDHHDVPLSAFRFGRDGGDPVTEAVEWCIERFQSGHIDPARLHVESRTTRLFTEVAFWLAQRETGLGFRRVMATWSARNNSDEALRGTVSPAAADLSYTLEDVRGRLASTLRLLARSTCEDLVTGWLLGTASERADWFDWPDTPAQPIEWSPKQRSLYVADALFRFFVLLECLLDQESPHPSDVVASLSLFSPCSNEPPYRLPDAAVAIELTLDGSRQASRLRKTGTCRLIQLCLGLAGDGEPSLRRELARLHLRPSLLHQHNLNDQAELRTLLRSLPAAGRAL